MENYAAFDIGGTSVKYGLMTVTDGLVTMKEHFSMETPPDLTGLLAAICQFTNAYKDIEGVAVSSPGAVHDDGVVYGASAVKYLHGPNIKQLIIEKTGLPVFLENDANCAALAEMGNGNAQAMNDFVMMVIGTGIGGAVVKNRQLHKGAHLHGGEFGYMLFHDDVANDWTQMDSTATLVKHAEKRKGLKHGTLDGEKVFALAASGDQDCCMAIKRFNRLLAMGIFNIQYVYDPEVILIGGGISAQDGLLEAIEIELDGILDQFAGKAKVQPSIKHCQFRQHANLFGAVYGLMREVHHD